MERNKWWLGLWLRGLRRTGWTNVKPACWWFTEGDLASDDPARRQRTINLRNALAPVALFDRDYDDLGIAPFVTGSIPGGELPVLAGGARTERTLLLYNDEFSDRKIDIEVTVRMDDRAVARNRMTFEVEPGTHREIPCRVFVPEGPGLLALEFKAFKGGVVRFEETRHFRVDFVPGSCAFAGPGGEGVEFCPQRH
jgi:hypothetical protein